MIKKFLIISLFILTPTFAFAKSGACSGHGGVSCSAGPDSDGSVICNDGWEDSSVSYSSMVMCGAPSNAEPQETTPVARPEPKQNRAEPEPVVIPRQEPVRVRETPVVQPRVEKRVVPSPAIQTKSVTPTKTVESKPTKEETVPIEALIPAKKKSIISRFFGFFF